MSNDERPSIDPAWMRGMMTPRFPRRSFLKYTGATAGAAGMASLLAACGGDSGTTGGSGAGGGQTVDFGGEPNGKINFANWPAYIDKAKDENGEQYYPSLRQFTEETGIEVNYQEAINSNSEFFGKIRPQLASGSDTGWDIIVISNSREFTFLTQNEWVIPLDPTRRPNFDANAADYARNPVYDDGNKVSMAWQSGITGIGVNTDEITAEITKLDDLADPNKVPQASVGMLKTAMPVFVMVNLGIDVPSSGPDEWKEAANWLLMQQETGVVRQYYEQNYLDDFQAGNMLAGMTWSGDVLYSNVWLGLPVDFRFPDGGAELWIDNMMIPAAAQNPVDAYMLMDYVYQPEVAQLITEWVQYMSPVQGVQDLIAEHADRVLDAGKFKGYGNKLQQTAVSEFLWPSEEFLARTQYDRTLTSDEEIEEWDSIFLPISEG